MKVYVLVTGMYDMVGIAGVFASETGAMAAWQPTRPVGDDRHSYAWIASEGWWTFDADWDDHAEIETYEVQE